MFTCDVTKVRSFAHNSLAVNYRLFSHGDVSYRFNGKNDNVVLECALTHSLINFLRYFPQATTEGPSLELPEVLQQYKILRSSIVDFKDDPHVHDVLSSFRDFSTILWLLHVRDELSIQLRKRGNQLHNEKAGGKVSHAVMILNQTADQGLYCLQFHLHHLEVSQHCRKVGSQHKILKE